MQRLQRHLSFAVGGTCVAFVWIVAIDLLFAANTQTKLQNIFVQIACVFVQIDKYICANSEIYLCCVCPDSRQ